MSVTHDMQLLFDRLYNQPAVQNQFRANPEQAVSGYALTTHERDAVVSRDLDDLVALGLASSISQLPEAVTGTPPGVATGAGGGWLLSRVRALLEALRNMRPGPRLPDRPDIPQPRPIPRPGPGPGPDPPRPDPPGPGPGPDPRG